MLHLFWSILNGIVFFYFLYLIFGFIAKGKRIFKPPFKVVSIIILIIGISQIIIASKSDKKPNLIVITTGYNEKNYSKIEKVILEDNLTFDINLLLKYSIEQEEFIPIESNSFLTGLVMGYVWEFDFIDANTYKPNETAEFSVSGTLKWNLFGINVYRESKTFNGIIK